MYLSHTFTFTHACQGNKSYLTRSSLRTSVHTCKVYRLYLRKEKVIVRVLVAGYVVVVNQHAEKHVTYCCGEVSG